MSETSAPKPRVLTVSSATAGARTIIVWNQGPREDACSYQATLTSAVAVVSSTNHREQGSVGGRKRLRAEIAESAGRSQPIFSVRPPCDGLYST